MKVVLAGAYGNLGAEIFKALLKAGHEVVAADMIERDLGVTGNFTFKKIDVTKPETLKGLCDGADCVVISRDTCIGDGVEEGGFTNIW